MPNASRVACPSCVWFLLLFLGIAVAPALAKTHPIPLDKNVDSAKCLECHEDKSKGKVVHSAIATGCLSCHEVRVNKDVTRVKLITSTPYTLCLSCHADKNAAELKGAVHPPAVRDCLSCHDPHTSENKNQLLKPLSGGEKENLCLNCHKTGLNVPEKGSRHAALDMGCDSCHTTHKTGEAGKAEFDFHLTKVAPALCLDCHDAKDATLQKAHHDQPFATADCTSCHDPHQSASPKLMRQFQADALKVLESPDRLPWPNFHGGAIYNFWQDAEHVRGIVRRTTLKDYLAADPKWETVLDYDALSKQDNQSWVAKDWTVFSPTTNYAWCSSPRAARMRSPSGR